MLVVGCFPQFRSMHLTLRISGGKHLLVGPIPIALKQFGWVVVPFQPQELRELGITRQHLFASREAMVSQIITAFLLNREVRQPPKAVRGPLNSFTSVRRVKVENDACVRTFGPD